MIVGIDSNRFSDAIESANPDRYLLTTLTSDSCLILGLNPIRTVKLSRKVYGLQPGFGAPAGATEQWSNGAEQHFLKMRSTEQRSRATKIKMRCTEHGATRCSVAPVVGATGAMEQNFFYFCFINTF